MKNKLGVEFLASEKFVGDLPVNAARQQGPKPRVRRESVTPKIVVCPPMEEVAEPTAAPRGARILKALACRLSRRATDAESLASSSSSDSVSCSGRGDRGDDRSSSTGSEASDGSDRGRRHRSTVSLRRVFQSLNLTSRSQSCSPTERQRAPKKQQQPKRILRPPVTYTYARGLSGLPTQRVPRYAVCTSLGLDR